MKFLFRLFILGAIVIICVSVIGIGYDYYTPASPLPSYRIPVRSDDTLRIAYIGDSWAFYHENHACKISEIIGETIMPTKVISKGMCGAKSKKIYQMMFAENEETFKKVLLESPQFCVIMAGVNDTYAKIGKNTYVHNIEMIIRFLLSNNIIPIIIAIPNFDINGAYQRQTLSKKLLRRLSMFITESDINCLKDYRTELEYRLQEAGLNKQIIYIKGADWDDSYGLYQSDCLHLNADGYLRLDTCIAQSIISALRNPR